MTSYFDALNTKVSILSEQSRDPDHGVDWFLEQVAEVEAAVAADISLVTGDREFPSDLREQLQGILACWSVSPTSGGLAPRDEAKSWVITTRSSRMINDCHVVFHRLASRRIQTRFGPLTDNPRDILKRRDAYDAPDGGF